MLTSAGGREGMDWVLGVVEEGQKPQQPDFGQLKLVEFHPKAPVGFSVSSAVALASRCGMGRNCTYGAVRGKE